MPVHIRLADESHLDTYHRHLKRIDAARRMEGDMVDEPFDQSLGVFKKKKTQSWAKPTTESGWERDWILADGQDIYGRLRLYHAIGLESTLHRAQISVAIEKPFRKQGLGTAFFDTALTWAKTQPALDWVQLYVLGNNAPALMLYRKLGFQGSGTVDDLFRVNGKSISDITMVLKLK